MAPLLKSLEEYLVLQHLSHQLHKDVIIQDLPEEPVEDRIFYTHRGSTHSVSKRIWSDPSSVFLAFIYADMISQGYLSIPIEGGWVIQGGEERYEIPAERNQCSCKDFLYNHTKYPGYHCRHLLFVEAELDYRRRVIQARSQLTRSPLS